MTELEKEEALIDRSNIEPYHPLNLQELAQRFIPKGAKFIPGFIYKYLRKVLHLDELNEFFEEKHNGTGQEFLDGVREHLNITPEYQGPGIQEIDALEGQSVMFVSNHPYGGPEGVVLFSKLHRQFPRARLLTQSFLKFIRPFSEVCVFNKKDLHTFKKAVEEERSLLIYPAGYCSRELSFGDVFDYDWKPTFVKVAKKNNMPMVVFYTDGHMSKRTLNITKIRNFFHIKAAIDSLFLPDELFKLRNQKMKMTAGHVIYPDVFDESVDYVEWAARLRQYCYELKTNPDAVFDPSKPATLPLR